MKKEKRFQNPYINRRKLELFGGAFLVTFMVIASLGIIFPQVRSGLHRSAALLGVSVTQDIASDALTEAPFRDVSISDPYAAAIAYLKKRGVVAGYEDGTFKPSQLLSRAELLKLIVRSQNADPHPLDYGRCFTDVGSEWFASSVCYAKSKGWIQGYDDQTFRPSQNITATEARAMVFKSFGVTGEDIARMKDLPDGDDHQMTRAEAAGLLAQTLSVKKPF